jgi:hypothetical protein
MAGKGSEGKKMILWLSNWMTACVTNHEAGMSKSKRAGRYPQRGKATMADVERLLSSGSRMWALRCYREIHGCSLRQAREGMDALLVKQ